MLSMALVLGEYFNMCIAMELKGTGFSLRSNIQFLQENLDHSRSKLADYETQVDELNYEITQLRVQNGSLNIALNKYKKYQDIWDSWFALYGVLSELTWSRTTKASAKSLVRR